MVNTKKALPVFKQQQGATKGRNPQEAASLSYFEARLRAACDPQERKDLENVVRNIKRAVETQGPVARPVQRSWSQSLCAQGGIGREGLDPCRGGGVKGRWQPACRAWPGWLDQ